ncbi:Choline transporter-like protein [Raphanus sativus]|nr:Choline transporter-like protein [Raphanus sativus]
MCSFPPNRNVSLKAPISVFKALFRSVGRCDFGINICEIPHLKLIFDYSPPSLSHIIQGCSQETGFQSLKLLLLLLHELLHQQRLSSSDYVSLSSGHQSLQRSQKFGDANRAIVRESRHWHDVFRSAIFVIHLICLGFVLAVLGLNRFTCIMYWHIRYLHHRSSETLTPKQLLILALQEAERNGNSIYIICLIRVEDSVDEDHTSQTFPLTRRYAIHVPPICYASVVALVCFVSMIRWLRFDAF